MNYGDSHTQAYAYDPMGNRLTKAEDGTTTQTCTYGYANLLASVNSANYTYDDNGNTLTDGARSMTWDNRNRGRL